MKIELPYRWVLVSVVVTLLIAFNPQNASAQEQDTVDAQLVNEPDIVGGKYATEAYPWMVQIIRNGTSSGLLERHVCGGTLIAPRWVLTARHCIVNPGITSPAQISVYVGRDPKSPYYQKLQVETIIIHGYRDKDENVFQNDVALLRLVGDVDDRISPMPLMTDRDIQQLKQRPIAARILGFGETSTAPLDLQPLVWILWAERRLKEADVHVADNSRCPNNGGSLPDNFLCVPNMNGVGSCVGDSGGPILFHSSDSNRWINVGITSFGVNDDLSRFLYGSCGQGYTAYTSVASYLGWIRRNMSMCHPSGTIIEATDEDPCGSSPPPVVTLPPPSTDYDPPPPASTPTPPPPSTPGGTTDPGPYVQLYPESSGSEPLQLGPGSHDIPTGRYRSFVLPAGWSIRTYYGNNLSDHNRCWWESVNNLQDHEEWASRMESVMVYSYIACPDFATGNDVILCTSDDAQSGCWGFPVGVYSLPAFDLNDKIRSVKYVPSNRSVMLFREGGLRGTVECHSGSRIPISEGEPWDLRGQVTDVQVFSASNCPTSQLASVIFYDFKDFHHYYWGMGYQPGVYNVGEVGGLSEEYLNDRAESMRIPQGMSAYVYADNDTNGQGSVCLTGDVPDLQGLSNQVSSVEIFPNEICKWPKPAQPTRPYRVGWTQTSVDLVWDDNSDNEYGFYIYQWNGDDWIRVGEVGPNVHTWTHTGLTCSTMYYYTVSAYNRGGESPRTRIEAANTDFCPQPAEAEPISPVNYAQFMETDTIVLEAGEAEGAYLYSFELWKDDHSAKSSGFQSAREFPVGTLEPGLYQWQVVSSAGKLNYNWSDWNSFVVLDCPMVTEWSNPGDLDFDGDVDLLDFNIMSGVMNTEGCPGFHPADINLDGIVNMQDFNLFRDAYNSNESPGAPLLKSPGGGTTIRDRTPSFTWQSSSNADQYRIQIDNNADFSSPIVDTTIGSTNYTAPRLTLGKFYWRVQAGNADENWGEWSDKRSFTLEAALTNQADGLFIPFVEGD